jgi:hypothetical protein
MFPGILTTKTYRTALRILGVINRLHSLYFSSMGSSVLRRPHLLKLLAYQRITVFGFRNSVNVDLQLIFQRRWYSLTWSKNLSSLPWPRQPVSGPYHQSKECSPPSRTLFLKISVTVRHVSVIWHLILTRDSTECGWKTLNYITHKEINSRKVRIRYQFML